MKPRNRGWIVFFVVLTILAMAGVAGNVVFNLAQQLTPAELAAARARWREHGPRDYELVGRREIVDPDRPDRVKRDEFAVSVRNGVPVKAMLNDAALPAEQAGPWMMDGWFDHVSRLLADDRAAGRRVFCTCRFDRVTGQVQHYVRRVSRTKERQEVAVKLVAPAG